MGPDVIGLTYDNHVKVGDTRRRIARLIRSTQRLIDESRATWSRSHATLLPPIAPTRDQPRSAETTRDAANQASASGSHFACEMASDPETQANHLLVIHRPVRR